MVKGEVSYSEECIRFVLANLRDWEVDSIVDFGSHAKGEAIEGSDYDLAIYLHSDRLFLPDFIQESEWFHDFMSRYPNLRFESTDLNSLLVKKWQDDGKAGSPLAPWGPWDIRWFAYRLAFETEGGNFLQLVCGQPLYDRGFYEGLIKVMQRDMPFHWNEGEENGMIDSLKRWCSAEREAMLDELQTIGKGRGEYGKTPWIYPSIYSVSHSIAALAFVEGGWPVWHKQDILRRVGGRFPEYLDSFSRAYDYKSTTPGRRRFIELVTQEPAKLLNELKSLTDDLSDLVDSIWGEIMLALKSDRSKIPMNITNWKERNDEIYAEFMTEYLRLS